MFGSMGTLLAQRYVLRAPLATGGSARLFEAEDTKLGRPVAVKLLEAPDEESQRRLAREARLAGSISHPNVCAVTDVGALPNGSSFLVMELLVGETLAERFQRQRAVPIATALDVAEQLLAGLDAAHAQSVVHRDIKPSNVFLAETSPGRFAVKLLDFGSAQVAGAAESIDSVPLTRTGYVIGTAEYMSPEQLRGVRDFDARTDVFSVAVVLYEMLAGLRPFEGVAMPARLQSIAYQKAPPLATVAPHVPAPIARAVDAALSLERERRPARARDLLVALRAPATPGPMTAPTRVLSGAAPKPATAPTPATAPGGANEWDLETVQQAPPSFDDD